MIFYTCYINMVENEVESGTCETKFEIEQRLLKQKEAEEEIVNRPVRSITTEAEEEQKMKFTNTASIESIEIENIPKKELKEGEISPENIEKGITSLEQLSIDNIPTENKKCNAAVMQYCNEFKQTSKLHENTFFIEFNLQPPCWCVNVLTIEDEEELEESVNKDLVEQKIKYKKIPMVLRFCPFCSGKLFFDIK